jgi:hypothetical protein
MLFRITDDSGFLNSRERAEYNEMVRHFGNEHAEVHNADEAKKSRLARYKSSAMTAKMEEARLCHHDEVSQKEQRAMAGYRAKLSGTMRSLDSPRRDQAHPSRAARSR